jgi:hypothetical protein
MEETIMDWPIALYITGIVLAVACTIIGAFIDEANSRRKRGKR